MTRKLKLLFILDPLEGLKAYKDSSIAMMRAAARRGHEVWALQRAGLTWREVALLRAYARYLKQIRMGFDLGYIASTLRNHTDIARELVRLCSQLDAKVNLIEYNAVDGLSFQRSDPQQAIRFQQYLQDRGITARIRHSRGRDIDAACGQLANKNEPAAKGGERKLKPVSAQKP